MKHLKKYISNQKTAINSNTYCIKYTQTLNLLTELANNVDINEKTFNREKEMGYFSEYSDKINE